jgi:hypothetical protein
MSSVQAAAMAIKVTGAYSTEGERHSGHGPKVFGFVPESLFTFIPERRSP